jgi:hypothetical protein
MNVRLLTKSLMILGCASISAQAPPASTVHTSVFGFSYSVPSDWQVTESQATPSEIRERQTQNAKSEEEKKGIACLQVALTARHGDPASVIVAMALPFDCFGQSMTEKDLPGFAQGGSEGLKQAFDLSEPVNATYSLGSHNLWLERAKGTPKGHPEMSYTVEIACGLLKKAAVCWMAMAPDENTLHIFENGAVVLDGVSFPALIPPTAFDKKVVP